MYKLNLLCLNIIKDGFVYSGKSVIPSFPKNANLSITLGHGHQYKKYSEIISFNITVRSACLHFII